MATTAGTTFPGPVPFRSTPLMDWSTAPTTRSRPGGETNTATGATGATGTPIGPEARRGRRPARLGSSRPVRATVFSRLSGPTRLIPGVVAITAYDLRYIRHDATDKADANWTVLDSVWAHQGNPFRQYRLEGLTNGVFYDVQMRAVNIGGASGWSNTARRALP